MEKQKKMTSSPSPDTDLSAASRHASEMVLKLAGILHQTTGAPNLTKKTPFRQLQALLIISEHGPMTVGDLGKVMNLAPSTGSELAARLVNAGFACRGFGGDDRRQCFLRLTGQGKREAQKYKRTVRLAMKQKMSALDTADRKEFLESLEKIVYLLETSR